MNGGLSVPGALPPAPLRHIENEVTEQIGRAVETAIGTNCFGAISGETGVGKTTTSAIKAAVYGGPVVYVNITSIASARQNFVSMFEAVTGTPAAGSATQIQHDLHDHLIMCPTTMLIDEAHRVRLDGLILLKGLFDLIVTTRGEGTPIILVGVGLFNHLMTLLPELRSRTNGRAEARCLNPTEAVDAIRVIQPRTRNNDTEMLLNLDKAYFKGNLGLWSMFFKSLNMIGGHSPTEPYAERDIKEALIRGGYRKKKTRAK